jgi:hypothetical protein
MIIQAHLGIIVALDVMLGWMVLYKAVGKIWRFLSNFSAQNLLINSHQAHQIASHPFHHLPMGLPDDNPSSFGHHCGIGRHAGLESFIQSCWQDLALLVQLFSPKPPYQQPSSTSDCFSSFSSSPNGSTR